MHTVTVHFKRLYLIDDFMRILGIAGENDADIDVMEHGHILIFHRPTTLKELAAELDEASSKIKLEIEMNDKKSPRIITS
jgi:hypothetical protein